jgi:hypothetical protein
MTIAATLRQMAAPEAIVKSEIHIDLSFVAFVPHVVALARINSDPDRSFRGNFVGIIIPKTLDQRCRESGAMSLSSQGRCELSAAA